MPKGVQGTPDVLPTLMKMVDIAGNENEVLRLRNGKIERGAFKGTKKQRFVGWFVQHFRGRKYKESYFKARAEDFQRINAEESYELALALQKDLSKRSPEPYDTGQEVTVKRAKELIAESKEDRETFQALVQKIVSPMLNKPKTLSDATHGATAVVDMEVTKQFLRRDVQVRQLRREVAQTLKKKGVAKESIEQLDKLLDDKAIKVNLFATARDYAVRLYAPTEGNVEWVRSPAVTKANIDEWKEKRALDEKQSHHVLVKTNASDLATKEILEEEKEPLLEGKRLKGSARRTHIQKLKGMPQEWAEEAAKLYDAGDAESERKATIIEREGRKNDERRNLQKKRHYTQDSIKSKNPFRFIGAKRKLQDIEKQLEEVDHQLMYKEHYQAKEEFPLTASHHSNYPPEHVDRVKARMMDHRPFAYSDVAMEKDDAIEKTVEMIVSKYPSFGNPEYEYLMDEMRQHLSSHLSDRMVAVATPEKQVEVKTQEVVAEEDEKVEEDNVDQPATAVVDKAVNQQDEPQDLNKPPSNGEENKKDD